jgi:hypothetical protein
MLKSLTASVILHYNSDHLLRSLCIVVFFMLCGLRGIGQNNTDSLPARTPDSVPPRVDTIGPRPEKQVTPRITDTPVSAPDTNDLTIDTIASAGVTTNDSVSRRPFNYGQTWAIDQTIPLYWQILKHHPYYDFSAVALAVPSNVRKVQGKEVMFYAMMGLLLVFALLKQGFGKYFFDLFRVFFRTTMKQRQIREQLMQTQFPSLIFNMFFIASAGLYINFMLHYFKITPVKNFWLLYLYCCIGLAVIYFGKFIGLKVIGWLLNMQKAADSYIFIVFIINKVIGIFLLPFLILIAFASDPVYSVSLVLSWVTIGVLLVYRLILGFASIRNEVRFNLFHFFLYLCAFEIVPLLLIYKLLLYIF